MSCRTDTDGGVAGSINLSQNNKVYDVLIDFGKVIDIPAVEILWEGACPQSYSLSVSREADFSDAERVDHYDPMRRAMVDRPRFDRFAVEIPEAYEAPSTEEQPAQIASRAQAADPKNGSWQAIRYVKLHNIVLDPWMGNVWGAKLAEVTPYLTPLRILNSRLELMTSTQIIMPTSLLNITLFRVFASTSLQQALSLFAAKELPSKRSS